MYSFLYSSAWLYIEYVLNNFSTYTMWTQREQKLEILEYQTN